MCKIKFIKNLIYVLFFNSLVFAQLALPEQRVNTVEKYIEAQKDYSKKINDIVEKIRLLRNTAHENYQNKVDKPLDELLLKISSESGAINGVHRFGLEAANIKPEYLIELESIKNKSNEIDLLEDKVLAKLSEIDIANSKAVEQSINSNKLKLESVENIDPKILEENIEKFKNYLNIATQVLQNIENNLIKELEDLFVQIENGIKTINQALEACVSKIDQEQKQEQDNKNINEDKKQEQVAPESVKQEEQVQEISLYNKIKNFAKEFVQDVKNKANELKK